LPAQSFQAEPQSTQRLIFRADTSFVPRWSPDSPRLIPVEVTIIDARGRILDSRKLDFGFRVLAGRSGKLRLNGEPLTLKAVSYYLISGDSGLPDRQTISADLKRIRNLGFNTVVTRQAPLPGWVLKICDEQGLFVVQALPVDHLPGEFLAEPELKNAARRYVEELLARAHNHPSLLALLLAADEVLGDPGVGDFLDYVRVPFRETPGIFTALHFGGVTDGTAVLPQLTLLDDRLLTVRYGSFAEQLAGKTHLLEYGIGGLAEAGNLNGYSDPYSEGNQAWSLERRLRRALGREGFAGFVVHAFSDWYGEYPLLWETSPLEPALHTDGLLTTTRREKLAAKVVHAVLTDSGLPPLTQGRHSPQAPVWFNLVPLLLGLLLVVGIRQNNVFAHNLRRSLTNVSGFYADIQSRRVFELGQGIFIALINSFLLGSILAATFYNFRKSLLFDELLTLLVSWSPIKEYLLSVYWRPLLGILYSGILIFLGSLGSALLFSLLGLFARSRATFSQMLHYINWSSSPLLFALPLALIYPHLLMSVWGGWLAAFLLLLFAFWHGLRLLRFLGFAFPQNQLRVLLVLLLVAAVFFSALFFYYESRQAVIERLHLILLTR
jgi:hypothetical protein